MNSMTEHDVERAAVDVFASEGFATLAGRSDLEDSEAVDRKSGALTARLATAIARLNTQMGEADCRVLALSVGNAPNTTLIENNRWFHDLLTNGVPVEYKDGNTCETRGARARLIDFDNPTKNDFVVVRQLTIVGATGSTIRPDLVLYVNGLPLVVIELKDPANSAATIDVAIDQLARYKTVAPDLFVPNCCSWPATGC